MFVEQGWAFGTRGQACIIEEISDAEKGGTLSLRKRLALLGTCEGTDTDYHEWGSCSLRINMSN